MHIVLANSNIQKTFSELHAIKGKYIRRIQLPPTRDFCQNGHERYKNSIQDNSDTKIAFVLHKQQKSLYLERKYKAQTFYPCVTILRHFEYSILNRHEINNKN